MLKESQKMMMPQITIAQPVFTPQQWATLVKPIMVLPKGAATDVYRLRASKPIRACGSAQFIWRMVAFVVSPYAAHHCIPVSADFDITQAEYAHRTDVYVPRTTTANDLETVAKWSQETWAMMHNGEKRKRYIADELNPIVDAIVDLIPKNEWRGAHRWSKAIYGQ